MAYSCIICIFLKVFSQYCADIYRKLLTIMSINAILRRYDKSVPQKTTGNRNVPRRELGTPKTLESCNEKRVTYTFIAFAGGDVGTNLSLICPDIPAFLFALSSSRRRGPIP